MRHVKEEILKHIVSPVNQVNIEVMKVIQESAFVIMVTMMIHKINYVGLVTILGYNQ